MLGCVMCVCVYMSCVYMCTHTYVCVNSVHADMCIHICLTDRLARKASASLGEGQTSWKKKKTGVTWTSERVCSIAFTFYEHLWLSF